MRSRVAQAIVLICIAMFVTSCFAPGKGPKAHAGYRTAAPVIAALEKFNRDTGHYPDDLKALVPNYLTKIPKRFAVPINSPMDGYHKLVAENAFFLGFTYYGPGVNHCTYESKSGRWTASGYY